MFPSDYIEFCREKMPQNSLYIEQVNSSLSHIFTPWAIRGSIYTRKGGGGGDGDWENQDI